MNTYAIVGMVLTILFAGFFIGATFIVKYTQHLIKTGKRVPAYLREVAVEMPSKYKSRGAQ